MAAIDAMSEDPNLEAPDLDAGAFSLWLAEMLGALRGERESKVPCNGCTACCTSSQFVHIEPDETDTLAHIPQELLFPAPLAPDGHVLLGYDEQGHCPMLIDDKCSIYEHRPRTCRTYDCRIFPATGITVGADDPDSHAIARRARRWRFSFPSDTDRAEYEAVRAAASSLAEGKTSATQRAVVAIEIHDRFRRS
jgi:Fe-S-cluster containining protein